MRIHEVPVDWVDDPDSRVAIVSTALVVANLGAAVTPYVALATWVFRAQPAPVPAGGYHAS